MPPDDILVFVCGNCGSRNFELYQDGQTECALCGRIGEPGHWHERVKIADGEGPEYTREIVNHGSAEFAKASVMKSAKDADVCAVVVVYSSGRVRAWSDVDRNSDDDRKSWVRRVLTTAANLINGDPDQN